MNSNRAWSVFTSGAYTVANSVVAFAPAKVTLSQSLQLTLEVKML
jgi:hypothetical protein